jgi:hypothetical protein
MFSLREEAMKKNYGNCGNPEPMHERKDLKRIGNQNEKKYKRDVGRVD